MRRGTRIDSGKDVHIGERLKSFLLEGVYLPSGKSRNDGKVGKRDRNRKSETF